MKYTLCITQQCNMRCQYCYIGKKDTGMPLSIAKKIIDFIFKNTPCEEKIDIGFFGGEPLLEFELIKKITGLIENHPSFHKKSVELTVVTNGTIFSDKIADFLNEHHIGFCLSCDGPPFVQDAFRRFTDGKGSSTIVTDTIRRAKETLPSVLVNAVYHPETFQYLPHVVEYLASLGLKRIYLNPDFSATWSKREAELLPEIYGQISRQYIAYYLKEDPHFISLIDSKIAAIMREGHKPHERCRMGTGEFAFTPSGNIYPCERLIGADTGNGHCIGNIVDGLNRGRMLCKTDPGSEVNTECLSCSLKDYCMNWCGCSNYFSSGYYNRVSPFLCAAEKTAIITAFNTFQTLEKKLGSVFFNNLLETHTADCMTGE
ncbi:MAG: radical SAM protein [Candidatus Brocadia sp.]|nr:radical SAM protein [Candidatus Brocadia sp.]